MHLPALGNNSSFLLRNALSLSSYEMLYLYLYLPALYNNLSLFLRNAYVFIFHKAANPKMHIFTLLWVLRSKVQIHCSWFSRDWRRNQTYLVLIFFRPIFDSKKSPILFQAKGTNTGGGLPAGAKRPPGIKLSALKVIMRRCLNILKLIEKRC